MSQREFSVPPSLVRILVAVAVLGIGATVIGIIVEPTRGWASLLTASYYYVTVALAGLVFIAITAAAKAGWTSTLKRVPEALGSALPLGALFMLVIIPGVHTLYHWSHAKAVAADPLLQHKAPLLNVTFYIVSMVAILAVWILVARAMRNHSLRQDEDGDVSHTHKIVVLSAITLVVVMLTFSLACSMWLMSIEPHWFSTIFGFYNIAGLLSVGVASILLVVLLLKRAGALPGVGRGQLHDLGKLTFGFAIFWGYLWFSQYMLIWYSNIPEETVYYVARTEGGWSFLFFLNLFLNFLVPFVALLPQSAKYSESNLLKVAITILIGRWLDIYLMVAPGVMPEHRGLGLVELGAFMGLGALFVLWVLRALRSAPLTAKHDPYLIEGIHHES